MRVYVYFNLNRSVWSIKALDGERKGKVIGHAANLALRDVTFKVSEAGRQRVIARRCREVHAGAIGTLCDTVPAVPAGARSVTYNPFRAPLFHDRATGAAVTACDVAVFTDADKYVRAF